jgi:DMSO/TMAO reductase YedYZ molybdopterin-dependent catalytic subunit
MRRMTILAPLGGLAALLLLAPAAAQVQAPEYSPDVTVDGHVRSPRTYTLPMLRALPFSEVVIQGFDDLRSRVYRGVTLYDLLMDAEPRFDSLRPGDISGWYVVVTSTDGRATVIAWGEIDPAFEGKPILVAYEQDGELLPSAGGMARLVVPFDRRTGRGVPNITTIALHRVDQESPTGPVSRAPEPPTAP